ncbi:MAG TPA: aminotransferase class III-fold pyridoxal phosphate-dependent enzyme [Gemmatimonadaceae bacterium]|nr:aminotransferase class III-fold pyridoxal phosphate-dependent enzyme [Gemmatimonadaceae bacterium]
MKVVAVIQARTSSSRFPGKVLAPIGSVSMIERMLSQLAGANSIDDIVVATSSDPSDDGLAAHVERLGVAVFRGDQEDVLTRFEGAAQSRRADIIVRLTGDCPLHTPDTVDEVVAHFLASDVDYASNTEPYTRPDGLDVEVFTREALARAAREALPGPDREHVTPFLRRETGVRRLHHIHSIGPLAPQARWTVDDRADLDFVTEVWKHLDRVGRGPHNYETVMTAALSVAPTSTRTVSNFGFYKSLYDAADAGKAPALELSVSEAWLARSNDVIPGGAQTYSKSWRQHIRGVSPIFLDRGEGARVWDVDGNEYVDLVQGLLPNILGYAHPDVDRAAFDRARLGHSFSLAHPIEVELAARLTRIIPCAELVRFGKNGSDVTSGAVRAARAFTGRDHVAICGYHGWHDWYIGTTTRSMGVPEAVRDLSHTFPYNDLDALDRLLGSLPNQFAAVIMEPFNFVWPADGYLEGVKEISRKHGAVLIFDEICTGFHLGLGGAQRRFGVTPDLATFGKAMGNGYPISCVAGRRDIMRMFEDVFMSFTFAGDAAAMAAAHAVLDILEEGEAYRRMDAAALALADGTRVFADLCGLEGRVVTQGHNNWLLLRFLDESGADDPALRALWLQEVTRRGVLVISTHNISAALTRRDVDLVLRAYAAAFKHIGGLLDAGADLEAHLDGPIPAPAFRVRS